MEEVKIIKELEKHSHLIAITCIIPSSRSFPQGLINDLYNQENVNFEIIICIGFSSPAKARNMGAKIAQGDIYVFIDDDVRISDKLWLYKMVIPIINKTRLDIGILGSAFVLPPLATKFEKRIAKEFDRIEFNEVQELIESDLAGANCLSISREIFNRIQGWNENFITGEDNKMRDDIRKLGYKPYIAPNTLVYHSRPKNYKELLGKYIWYYYNAARGMKHGEYFSGARVLNSVPKIILYFMATQIMLLIDLFWHGKKRKLTFRPLYASIIYFSRLTYIWGWIK